MRGFGSALAVVFASTLALACAAVAACVWAGREQERRTQAVSAHLAASRLLQAERGKLAGQRETVAPLESFLAAWAPHLGARVSDRDLAEEMRASLEELAQRKLGLITDQATTPEAARVRFGGRAVLIQRVALRASGESLNALLAWLGEAEALYPYARVEACELAAGVGGGSSLRLVLAQPLAEPGSQRRPK